MNKNPEFIANYHSHTARCGHAIGTDKEYVEAAIKAGFKIHGVSDHVIIPGRSQERMRGEGKELDGYFASIESLKKEYEGKIKIYSAFEAEYLPDEEDYYRELLSSKRCEYLLLGQHCFLDYHGRFIFYSNLFDSKLASELYFRDVIDGMESGLFLYLCHPDLFMEWCSDWSELEEEGARKIISTAIRLSMPLELNMGCLRRRYFREHPEQKPFYPDDHFWDLVSESNAHIVLGLDAHNPADYLGEEYDFINGFIKKHHLKIDYSPLDIS